MPGIGLAHPGWRHAHVAEAKSDRRLGIDQIAVARIDEVHGGIGRRGLAAGRRSRLRSAHFRDGDPHGLGSDRRIMRHMLMVAQQKLQRMLPRCQRHLCACLASSEMNVV